MPDLRITEILRSLQSEVNTVGLPTVFMRLTGCPLWCQYCDSAYTFSGGILMPLDEIMRKVGDLGVRHGTVAGGESVAQSIVLLFIKRLADASFSVSVETCGTLGVEHVPAEVVKVLDLKTPYSKESHRNLWSNLAYLNPQDQVKFVI